MSKVKILNWSKFSGGRFIFVEAFLARSRGLKHLHHHPSLKIHLTFWPDWYWINDVDVWLSPKKSKKV